MIVINTRKQKALMMGVVLLSMCMILSCQQHQPELNDQNRDGSSASLGSTAGIITVFLNVNPAGSKKAGLTIHELTVLHENQWLPLLDNPKRIDLNQLNNGQAFIARRNVPRGQYVTLRLKVSGDVSGENRILSASPQIIEVELELRRAVRLTAGMSESIFINLNWQMFTDDLAKSLSLSAAQHQTELWEDLACVLCEEINTVFFLRTDKNQVCSSIGIPRPVSLQMDSKRKLLYVLSRTEAALFVIDLVSHRIKDKIRLPHSLAPHYFVLSPDQQWAYILDHETSNVLLVDLLSGRLAAYRRLSQAPNYATFLSSRNLLAVSSDASQTVQLLTSDALLPINSLSVGFSPRSLLDGGDALYVVPSHRNVVTLYNFRKPNNNLQMAVGRDPRRAIFADENVYVSNFGSGTISKLASGQFSIAREIVVGGTPLEMAYAPKRQWLYVGDVQQRAIKVIDATSNKLTAAIKLGCTPGKLVVANE